MTIFLISYKNFSKMDDTLIGPYIYIYIERERERERGEKKKFRKLQMMVWKNIIDFTIKILQINISLIIKNNFNIYLLCYKYLPIILVKFVIFLAFYKIFIIVNFHLLNFISHTHTHI